MISLNKDSWFVKYWVRLGCTERGFEKIINGYERRKNIMETGLSSRDIPPGTNLCQLVRIVAIYAPLKALAILAFFGFIITLAIAAPATFFSSIGIIVAFFGTAAILTGILKLIINVSKGHSISNTLPVQYIKAVKGKYCPRITIS